MAVSSTQQNVSLHLMFSALLLVEGTIRACLAITQGHNSPNGWRGAENQYPPIVLLLGAVAEMFFASSGLALSLMGIVYGTLSEFGTKIIIAIEICFGWFTLLVWVLSVNIYNASKDNVVIANYDNDQADAISTISIFGGLAYCGSLQGAQVYFANSILADIKGIDRNSAGALKVRFAWYSFLFLVGSVAQLAIGAFVTSNFTPQNIFMPPFVVSFEEISLAVGLFSTIVALFGLARLAAPIGGTKVFGFMVFTSWLCHYSMSVVTQVGTFGTGPCNVFVAGPLTGLVLSLHFMPAYFDSLLHNAQEKE